MKNTLRLLTITVVLIIGSITLVITRPWQNWGESTAKDTSSPTATADVQHGSQTKLNGCDLSHWNGEVDWPALKKTDISFVFVKATQGTAYVDPTFEHNWSTAANYGFHRGAYHFYAPKDDPKAQAEHFLATIKPQKGDLLPVLDIEVSHGVDKEQLSDDIGIWINTVKEAIGRYPILYTDRGFWNVSIDKEFSHCPLWLAEWETAHAPSYPNGWQNWVFWQYSASGTVDGIPSRGKTDLDWFNGGEQGLRNYMIR